MKMRMKAEMLCDARSAGVFDRNRAATGRETGDLQANDTPENDDINVEDVGDTDCKAEDYADYAGPGDGGVSFGAQCETAIMLLARTIVRIYL